MVVKLKAAIEAWKQDQLRKKFRWECMEQEQRRQEQTAEEEQLRQQREAERQQAILNEQLAEQQAYDRDFQDYLNTYGFSSRPSTVNSAREPDVFQNEDVYGTNAYLPVGTQDLEVPRSPSPESSATPFLSDSTEALHNSGDSLANGQSLSSASGSTEALCHSESSPIYRGAHH
jgi:hypothetical protein